MQIKEMLEYQKLDGEIRKLKSELAGNEDRKNATKMQDFLKDGQNKLVSLEKTSEKLVGLYKKATAAYNDFAEKLEKLLKEGMGNTPEEVTTRLEKANAFMVASNKLEKDLESLMASLSKVNAEFDSLMKNSKTAKANFEVYKSRYNDARAKIEPKINEIKAKLDTMKSSINPEMLAKYNHKAESKYPVFVPVKDNRCGGCRMEISGTKLKQLKETGYIECENCGRIIFNI